MAEELYDPFTTLLRISGAGVSPFASRGMSQSLEPIAAASQMFRNVNGGMIDTLFPQFKKYKSTITCSDQVSPAFEGFWPGQVLTIDCIAHLSYKTSGGAPGRIVVPDSSREEGDYTRYRPRITFMVMSYTTTEDEWGAVVSWVLELEEV